LQAGANPDAERGGNAEIPISPKLLSIAVCFTIEQLEIRRP